MAAIINNKAPSLVTIIVLALVCKFTAATGRRSSSFFSTPINATTDDDNLSANGGGVCKLFITNQGYKCEEHTVKTKDGYLLSLQRIPVGRSGRMTGKKIPVLLQHGIMDYALTWLLLPPHQSLAFVLADQGYDVWISNVRGTKYSRRHVSLSANSRAFWDWTWDQLAQYDLTANVAYVNRMTGQKMHYVGHSLGTTMLLAGLSRGLVANHLRSASLICPISYIGNLTAIFFKVGASLYMAEELHLLMAEYDVKGYDPGNIVTRICQIVDCRDILSAVTGLNCCIDRASMRLYTQSEPQPTSVKNIVHTSQMVRRGSLTMYDYLNQKENMKHYGQKTPPKYHMKDIPKHFPLFMSYGGMDGLSDPRDVKRLLGELKDHDRSKGRLVTQYVDNFAHMDFVMSGQAKKKVYDGVLNFLKLH